MLGSATSIRPSKSTVAIGMTRWWAGSIIRSIPWESRPFIECSAAKGLHHGNARRWYFASFLSYCSSFRFTSWHSSLFGGRAAWLAALLVILNSNIGSVVVNVFSESTFLAFWTFGLWGSVRFLREGRFLWLPLAIGFGALAYLTRPEGMLLPVALTAALLILPMLRSTRINWPRWWGAIAFVLAGLVFLIGPYIALKGGRGHQTGDRPSLGTGTAVAALGP